MPFKLRTKIGDVTAQATKRRQSVSLHLGRVTVTRGNGGVGISVRLVAGVSWFKWWNK